MADGVAKVQLHPFAPVKFVGNDHVALMLHAPGNDSIPVKRKPLFHEMGKQLRIVKNAVLDDLRAAVPENILRQGVQHVNITQHQPRLTECAYQILPGRQVNGGFAAHGGIYRGQKGSGDLDIGNAPEIGGSHKAGHIANHTAA